MSDSLSAATKIRLSAVQVGRGFCKCGCGEQTTVADRTHRRHGWVKGEPKRYVFGHQRVKRRHWLVDPATGCWEYQTIHRAARYAMAESPRHSTNLVHRQNYEDAYGPVPDGLELDHLCRNKRCVNPDHLEAVTHGENMRRYAEQ